MWWDARIDEPDREKPFTYTAYPVVGSANAPTLMEAQATAVRIVLPEPDDRRTQIDTIVHAINNATHSVLFFLLSSTDQALRDACFAAGDKGLMMFGVVNAISEHAAQAGENKQKQGGKPTRSTRTA